MSDFRDALIGTLRLTFTVTNQNDLAMALAKLGDDRIGTGLQAAIDHWRNTGELLPGVEVKEESDAVPRTE